MRDIVKLGVILMTYAVIAGAALAYVNVLTSPRVEANRSLAEESARSEALPGMRGGFDLKKTDSGFEYWIGYSDPAKTQVGGYIFIARERGYSSMLETMVGISPTGDITGTKVIHQQETPGLGTKITEIRHGESEPWFQKQFIGKTLKDDLKVKQDGGMLDAVTGATISSRAMAISIRDGLIKLNEAIGGTGI